MAVWQDKFINVNGYARSGKKLHGVRKLVIHWTANPGATAMNHYNYFNNLHDRYASAHIFVDKTEAICIIPLDEVAYHANDVQERNPDGTPWRGVPELLPNANYLSIGVEMCVEKDGTFHPDTVERTVEVFAELCKRYNLDPLKDIVRHWDITHKHCPEPWVKDPQKFIEFKQRVDAKLKGTVEKPAPAPTPTPSKPTVSAPEANKPSATPSKPASAPAKPAPAPSKPKYVLPDGILKLGDKGDAVKQLQTALNALGYNVGAVDGVFGAKTELGLRAFQKANKLVVDGIYGSATKKALSAKLN